MPVKQVVPKAPRIRPFLPRTKRTSVKTYTVLSQEQTAQAIEKILTGSVVEGLVDAVRDSFSSVDFKTYNVGAHASRYYWRRSVIHSERTATIAEWYRYLLTPNVYGASDSVLYALVISGMYATTILEDGVGVNVVRDESLGGIFEIHIVAPHDTHVEARVDFANGVRTIELDHEPDEYVDFYSKGASSVGVQHIHDLPNHGRTATLGYYYDDLIWTFHLFKNVRHHYVGFHHPRIRSSDVMRAVELTHVLFDIVPQWRHFVSEIIRAAHPGASVVALVEDDAYTSAFVSAYYRLKDDLTGAGVLSDLPEGEDV